MNTTNNFILVSDWNEDNLRDCLQYGGGPFSIVGDIMDVPDYYSVMSPFSLQEGDAEDYIRK